MRVPEQVVEPAPLCSSRWAEDEKGASTRFGSPQFRFSLPCHPIAALSSFSGAWQSEGEAGAADDTTFVIRPKVGRSILHFTQQQV